MEAMSHTTSLVHFAILILTRRVSEEWSRIGGLRFLQKIAKHEGRLGNLLTRSFAPFAIFCNQRFVFQSVESMNAMSIREGHEACRNELECSSRVRSFNR